MLPALSFLFMCALGVYTLRNHVTIPAQIGNSIGPSSARMANNSNLDETRKMEEPLKEVAFPTRSLLLYPEALSSCLISIAMDSLFCLQCFDHTSTSYSSMFQLPACLPRVLPRSTSTSPVAQLPICTSNPFFKHHERSSRSTRNGVHDWQL